MWFQIDTVIGVFMQELGIPQVVKQNPSTNVENSEFWTNKQRQMNPIHYTVSYRGSFKPELPHFFISKFFGDFGNFRNYFSNEEDKLIFDPFAGRGTTIIQANLMGHNAMGNDINPLFERICFPLTHPPTLKELEERINKINFFYKSIDNFDNENKENLLPFFHPKTLLQLLNLKEYLKDHRDDVDRFIEVIALSRLHGHSPGFFSAYSFPQISVPPRRQKKINAKHGEPVEKNLAELIMRKAKRSIRKETQELNTLRKYGVNSCYTQFDTRNLPKSIYKNSFIDLIITSPPFLAQVDYLGDNWLEFWFLNINPDDFKDKLVMTNSLETWKDFIEDSLVEMYRVLKERGVAVIEVGDVKYNRKRVNLDDIVEEIGKKVGFSIIQKFIHIQKFTKLSNCFNVRNNLDGVNTQRMVAFTKK